MTAQTPERFRRVDELFAAALDLAPNERAAFLTEQRGEDPSLIADVRRLLDSHDRSAAFLEAPAVEVARALLDEPLPVAPAPTHAGPFRIVRELGHGGMGVVYLAERDDAQVEQRVALKLIRHAGTDVVVRRFLDERRILARLEHPGIARFIDGGLTPEGLPYLAMELVEGEPIDAYCDARRLTLDQRIELFTGVCDAVQYAHEHFVIHRDLKPSNILVREGGQLKLLDFGIAKLLDPVDGESAGRETRTGMLALTPEYAAPEQIRGDAVSTATDTYALGVLLYALLCGRHPYDVRGRSPAELERMIGEVEAPRPSATLGGSGEVEADLERARVRGTTPDRLRRRLRGDLDVIVLKALQKDPARRYSTPAVLREDLERWRSGRPIGARPDSAMYRMRKFVRRNRAATLVLVLIVAYAVTVTVQRERVRRALAEATLGAQRAQAVSDFMLGLFEESEAGQSLTDTVTARSLLARGEARATELSAQPALQAQMFDVIGQLQTQLGQNDRAKVLLEQALAIRERLYGRDNPDYLTTLENLATTADRSPDVKKTVALRRQLWETERRVWGSDNVKTVSSLYWLSQALHTAGDEDAAQPLFESWLSAIARLPKEQTPERAMQLSSAALVLEYRGELERAEPLIREALETRRALYGERHHAVAQSLDDLGGFYEITHRHAEAEPLLRQAVEMLRQIYPEGSPQLAGVLRSWATVLEHTGRYADALPALREVLRLYVQYYGENNLDVTTTKLDVSTALSGTNQYVEAEAMARDAIGHLGALLGEKNAMVSVANVHLGNALRGEGRFVEAERVLLAAYARFTPPKRITRNWHNAAASGLVKLYDAERRPDEAAKYRAAIDSGGPSKK